MPVYKLHPETWVDRYANYLFNYAIAQVNDAEMAKDLVQETFFAGLNAAGNYKGHAAERTWLIAILKRKIIDYYRKNSEKGKAEVRIHYNSPMDAAGSWLEHQAADPFSRDGDRALENQELGLAIQECISRLPKKQALVFTLKTIQGRSTEAICNKLAINLSNLWVTLHRARTSLMKCLNKNWF